ncbi:hypothetical protein [Aeromonas sp. MR16]|uniref:hypothetical protein n=1 Tax=Aeromonas sp. MR16 TaxID=2923420 RepID=UPI001F4B5268|nr:hypothetical protein [Aeromonas sp. MR16]MCH7372644.1 hypothetical protein [Aeromonas sp. MR16]
MKAIIFSLLIPIGVSAVEQDYRLTMDSWVDGVLDSGTASSSTIVVNVENGVISPGNSGDLINGSFIENEKIVNLKQSSNQKNTYYLGKLIDVRQYQGVWYDIDGNGGDFRIEWGNEETPDCRLATETGWYHGLYCNTEIDGGGWRLVAVRYNKEPYIPVETLTELNSNQYLNPGAWVQLKDESTEILFLQPDTNVWGVMNISQASNQKFCSPLGDNLSKKVLVHAEKEGCSLENLDYTVVGHPGSLDYQGNFYRYKKGVWTTNYPDLWARTNWAQQQDVSYGSSQLMVFVR